MAFVALTLGCVPSGSGGLNLYETCTASDTCSMGTDCLPSSVSGPGLGGDFCSVTCTVGSSACPGDGVCVAPPGVSTGVCHARCAPICSPGQSCVSASSAGVAVCVPGTTTAVGPTATAYEPCTSPGSVCADGTTCQPALAPSSGGTPGDVCTQACRAASDCPGFTPDLVACLPGASGSVCTRTCQGDIDCSAYGTRCATVTTSTGTVQVCAP